MPLVELARVRYFYEDATKYALDDIDFQLEPGEFVLLAGASGSGKSTFCRLLNGLIPHFHGGALGGIVRVDGLDTREHPVHELFGRVGLVFQNPDAQLFNSTVARELAFGLESQGLPRDEILARVEWAIRATHIEHLRDRAPHSLSGGEQQIVAIASILALRPSVLVLDEPFANLDPETIARVRGLLREIHAAGTAIIVAEHRLHASLQDATRLVVLDHGRVVRDGPPREVLRDDVSAYHLNTPFVVRLAHASGWRELPLSVDEAVSIARAQKQITLPAARNGAHLAPLDAPLVLGVRDVAFIRDGREILRDIRLDLARGECVALVGRNGSGKTTLLKHLNGLYRPSRGEVLVKDLNTQHTPVSTLAGIVSLVLQNPNDQLFKPNVREEIEVGPRALGRLDPAWIDQLIDRFALRPLLDRSPFTLSEGEKKRVAFAAALAARPEILALDEPTTGQDLAFRTALARLLQELQDQGVAIILATHDLEYAEQVATRWVVLADGQVVAAGSPDEVMGNPQAMDRAALRPTARFRFEREVESGHKPLHASSYSETKGGPA